MYQLPALKKDLLKAIVIMEAGPQSLSDDADWDDSLFLNYETFKEEVCNMDFTWYDICSGLWNLWKQQPTEEEKEQLKETLMALQEVTRKELLQLLKQDAVCQVMFDSELQIARVYLRKDATKGLDDKKLAPEKSYRMHLDSTDMHSEEASCNFDFWHSLLSESDNKKKHFMVFSKERNGKRMSGMKLYY